MHRGSLVGSALAMAMILSGVPAGAQWQPTSPAPGPADPIYRSGSVAIGKSSAASETLDVNGNILLVLNAQIRTTNSLTFRETTSVRTVVRVMPSGSLTSSPSSLEFFGTDYVANPSSYERLRLIARGTDETAYVIKTESSGPPLRPLQITTGSNPGLLIDANGVVSIAGTTVGTDTSDKLIVNGGIRAAQVIGAVYQDVAEWVPASEPMTAGTVVIVDPAAVNGVAPSKRAYDTAVAGVISARPGVLLGAEGPSKVMVATTGRVKVKVDATRGPIHAGDLLVTSGYPGLAMRSEPVDVGGIKMHRPGTLIGKALEPLESGQGEILVLLSLQ